MRIALNLQACQTSSRLRGIGRYAFELTDALVARAPSSLDYVISLDGTYPDEAAALEAAWAGRVAPAQFARFHYPRPVDAQGALTDFLRPAAEALIVQAHAQLAADLVHVHSLFEGFADPAAGIGGIADLPGGVASVTLYDLIPLVYPATFVGDAQHRRWYHRKLSQLKRFDVCLCISQATRRDAEALLDLPPERLAVIYAGLSSRFSPAVLRCEERLAAHARLGISGPFVLYTGNGDARKNLHGAISAFAAVPAAVRSGVQLVLNQVGDERSLRQFAARAGLAARDLVITGHVSDDDLLALYRTCEVFFFPSLYEGFGLPVLEAMACGACVIAGNNSSLPEIVGRADALFDAANVEDSARVLAHVLADTAFRKDLAHDGPRRAAAFTWERTAQLTEQAWQEAIERKRGRDPQILLGARPRMRIALVAPLPPQQTGIADYVAELLPALAAFAEVDVYTTAEPSIVHGEWAERFVVAPCADLPTCAASYDAVIYQFGNSPFHAVMVDLIDRVPGIVVLHDVFLSSMFDAMDRDGTMPGVFAQELERSHGREATQFLAQEGALAARRRFPASLRIVQRARGLILHSEHAADLCRRYFPTATRGPWQVIPHLRRLPQRMDGAERRRRRIALGIEDDDYLIVSFGFLADTKLVLQLLDAMAHPSLAQDASLHLTFVGENDGGEYGVQVLKTIDRHPLALRISITGYASRRTYEDYLAVADCAVQLRAFSRGESSGAVLDCMAYGVPLIVNDYASFTELPADAVVKVHDPVDPAELASAIADLRSNESRRGALSARARAVVARDHAPHRIAAEYSAFAAKVADHWRFAGGDELVAALGRAAARYGSRPTELDATLHALAQQQDAYSEPRLLIDLSEVVSQDYGTGIHRVVRNLARELILLGAPDWRRVTAVSHAGDGAMVSAERFASERLGLPPLATATAMQLYPRDVLLLLDSAWERTERFQTSIRQARSVGARVGAFVYDLIPLRYPQYCIDYMPMTFERWLRFVLAHCDFIVCISRATADDLAAWVLEERPSVRPALRIGHVMLGCELDRDTSGASPSDALVSAFTGAPVVLMVGTVEPRKRYDVALDAFDALWRAGSELRLVIVGRHGWNVDAVVARIRSHPELGRRLFWLEQAGDGDLQYAYRHASALLMTSAVEGFGLPVVEAARYGVPLLLSDIPVFREVAGSNANYFIAGDVRQICRYLASLDRLIRSVPEMAITWQESAARLRRLIDGRHWDHFLS